MPHLLHARLVPAALIVLAAACDTAISEPARTKAVVIPPAGPTLTVSPTSRTFNAGDAARAFDATLLNTTATLSWSLSAAVGGISPAAGPSVAYTPPLTIDATTVVTLTVSGAGLSARARITVQPVTAANLTVAPATASTSAGGATLGFDASLANTTGTISWSLSPSVGSVSPATGTHVTYTPPPTLATTTTVTLTATRGTLTDSAVITVGPPPSLTVTPPTASTSAGGGTLGFDAALVNTSGTITWSLSEVLGSVSPSTGTHVTYTPPATVDADTVVTLTATKGTLSDTAVITVRKPGAPTPANVVNHTNFDPGAIPVSYLNTVRSWDILFQHKSVGYNMNVGMEILAAQNATRYAIAQTGWNYGWRPDPTPQDPNPIWQPGLPPATWFDSHTALGNTENGHSTCPQSKPIAFDQTMRGQPISYSCPNYNPSTYNDSLVSGEYGAHVRVAMMKFCFEEVWGTLSGQQILTAYSSVMDGLIAAYPNVDFVWMTMPLPFVSGQADPQNVGVIAYDFNVALRAYIASHGGYLLDVADLQSNCQDGSTATDARGHPAVCESWSYNFANHDPHMSASGQERLARGLWSILARIAGYAP